MRKKSKSKSTTDAFKIAYDRFIAGDKRLEARFFEEWVHAEVARELYALRTRAGLSQKKLAETVGTTASVICRLEDGDYKGHSLSMLNRIAAALNSRIQVRFLPLKKRTA